MSALEPEAKSPKSRRLAAGDAVGLERENGDWMKGVVVQVEDDGIDVVVDGTILEGEVLSVSRTVRDDARYTAVMEVVNAGKGRSRVRLVGDWKRTQMRHFVRVSVFGMRMDVDGQAGGRLLDLSAGGLGFESPHEYARGEILEFRFALPQSGPVSVRGEILRVAGRRNGESGPYHYGVSLTGLDESVRVKIMTWVFAEQARRFRDGKKPET